MDNDRSTIFSKSWRLPFEEKIKASIKSFSLTERLVFAVSAFIFVFAGLALLYKVNSNFLVQVPEAGGTYTEGIIGMPRFINPLLATSDADKDLTTLIYSGLIKPNLSGGYVGDLAKFWNVSTDGLVYTFTLKDNLYFSDGAPLTTEDIEFTVLKAQDPTIKSSKRAGWDGVTVQKISTKEIRFVLRQAYAPFIENATMGILPKHIWKDVASDEFSFSEINVNPVGSGPYKVKSIERSSLGLPTSYDLIPFSKYALGKAWINHLIVNFYLNEKDLFAAYDNGDIESVNSVSPKDVSTLLKNGVHVESATLPRVFGVFLNQNQSQVFSNKEVREALNIALNKQRIVDTVLQKFGSTINGPLNFGPDKISTFNASSTERAISLLSKAGWAMNEKTGQLEKKTKKQTFILKFSISTGDTLELKRAAQMIQEDWQKIGAVVDIKIFETGDLNQNVIRTRKYDALLFGEVVGRSNDVYPFWHSSQRNDPGLNIALYANTKTDKLLEDARSSTDDKVRNTKYAEFENIIEDDLPAIFIYSPDLIYIVPDRVRNISIKGITNPAERFLDVNRWYIETNDVWKIFNK